MAGQSRFLIAGAGLLGVIAAVPATPAPRSIGHGPHPLPRVSPRIAPGSEADDNFELSVRPVLAKHCGACHGPDVQSGNLRLDRPLPPGAASKIADAIRWDSALKMPPSGPLPKSDRDALSAWANAGAPWPATDPAPNSSSKPAGAFETWAYQPLRPGTPDPNSTLSPIDQFIRTRLQRERLAPAPPADRRTLLRRVTFDLTGLPPTPDDIAAFLADQQPGAYERVVDRLLSSPAYGERMARPWLDLVRYADTNGYERDADKPFAWKYRDWVVRSFNTDKPYPRFVAEQLAGDEMPGRNIETVTATGFLRLGTWDDEPNDPNEYQYERLDDLVHATSTAFLGLTVRCARCHDHKYDPIPQKDYYALAAAFWAGYVQPGGGAVLGGPPPAATEFANVLTFTDKGPNAPPLHLLAGGDFRRPGPIVPPGVLAAVPKFTVSAPVPADPKRTTGRRLALAGWITHPENPLAPRVVVNRIWQHHFGTGLSATPDNLGAKGSPPTHPELLDWLADRFRTPESEGGWGGRLKPLHRAIVLSRTYRQASVHPSSATAQRTDPNNTLLWRFPRRRLDADSIRDSVLAVSGKLVRTVGGPGFVPTVTREALEGLSKRGAEWQPSEPREQDRRTLYLHLKRALIPPTLTVLDFGDTTAPLARRDTTTVAPQALAMLNNPWFHQQADAFARRIVAVAGTDRTRQVRTAWRLALGCSPTEREERDALGWLARFPAEPATKQPVRASRPATAALPTAGLRLWLRADQGVETDPDQRVTRWRDQSGGARDAVPVGNSAPIAKPGAVEFDGNGHWLRIHQPVITEPQFTVVAVVADNGGSGLREIFSNWNGKAGNSTTSVFLGLTGPNQLRFSDQFNPAGTLRRSPQRTVATAISGPAHASVFQGRREIFRSGGPMVGRNLAPPWVIGQQGNIMGEYWSGAISELIVWDRALSDGELETLWNHLASRHPFPAPPAPPTPADPGLASLARILINTNEFVVVD